MDPPMTDDSKPPKLSEEIRKWVFRRLGVPGLVGLALLAALFYVYTNWAKVKTWPGMASIVTLITRDPILEADLNRFSVLVANLEEDEKRREKWRIIHSLMMEFKGIQVLPLDRTIFLKGSVPEEMEKQGQESARRYLEQSRASVLIWGAVIRGGEQPIYKLYWTPARGEMRKPESVTSLTKDQLRLPVVFWSDLADILRLLVVARNAEFRNQEGHYVDKDRLRGFINRVRTLLKASPGRPGWDADARGATLLILADSLQVLGDQSGQNEPLEEAVEAYREALKEYTRERVPLKWAKTQNNLGFALWRLGEREKDAKRLEEAVAAYHEALKVRTRERVPQDWAETQNNLGNALRSLGERERDTKRLEKAVEAYNKALEVYTREGVPLDRAETQSNLCLVLLRLGERERGTKRLWEAVKVCRRALTERTQKLVPLYWAETQNNLGTALLSLGNRKGDPPSSWRRRWRPTRRLSRCMNGRRCPCTGP
jgi:tetratricopeptide (TPR) repeat protein